MAKKKTLKKKVHRWRAWVLTLFMISIALQLTSAIILRSYQTNLSVQIQRTERKVAQLQVENESLNVDIQRLSNYNRIVTMASEHGYTAENQNVITVFKANE